MALERVTSAPCGALGTLLGATQPDFGRALFLSNKNILIRAAKSLSQFDSVPARLRYELGRLGFGAAASIKATISSNQTTSGLPTGGDRRGPTTSFRRLHRNLLCLANTISQKKQ